MGILSTNTLEVFQLPIMVGIGAEKSTATVSLEAGKCWNSVPERPLTT